MSFSERELAPRVKSQRLKYSNVMGGGVGSGRTGGLGAASY